MYLRGTIFYVDHFGQEGLILYHNGKKVKFHKKTRREADEHGFLHQARSDGILKVGKEVYFAINRGFHVVKDWIYVDDAPEGFRRRVETPKGVMHIFR